MKKHIRRRTRLRKARLKKKEGRSHRDAVWERRLGQLKEFRRRRGHCQVPSRSKKHPSLGHWVQHQRVLKRAGRLDRKRMRRLQQVGFDWVSRGRSVEFRDSAYWDKKWEGILAKLARFKQQFGHCWAPAGWRVAPRLSQWVSRQRRLKQQGRLSKDRRQKLDALGLDWRTDGLASPRWERCYVKLLEFRRRFGHCHVPAEWAEDINLGRWVVKTRRLKRAGRLGAYKVRRLNEIGFVWDAIGKREVEHDAIWSEWLAKLEAFHRRRRHWRVPTEQHRFHRLRVWMDNQRISYQRGWLTADRIRRLEKIGFPWVSDRGARLSAEARAHAAAAKPTQTEIAPRA